MTRRDWIAAGAAPLLAAAERRPNIIFISTDDHHYQCLGAVGNPHIRTPNMDRLAARGINFTNGQISTAQCAPSRGILLSGLETFQSGLLSNGAMSFREGLGPTVIEQLRTAGYETALVGKWHVRHSPRECGFTNAPLWLRGGSSRYLDPQLVHGLDGAPKPTPGHITDLFTDSAIEVVRSRKQPLFLWLSYNAPHSPWQAADKYRGIYAGKDTAAIAPPAHPKTAKPFDWLTYYAVITHLDESLGRLLDELDRSRALEDTYVFLIGDNGFMCGARGLGGKVVPWEPSVRVPFMAAGAGVPRRVKSDAPVASIDLPATWLELAGVKPAKRLAGRNLTSLLKTGKGGPEAGFSVWHDGRPEALTVRTAIEPYRVIRTRTHKLIVWESRKQALYNIAADPGEQQELDSPETLRRLRAVLAARMNETADPARAWLA
jgi:arylsulfatase A-like enzyme